MKSVVVLGSTGSIGRQALKVLDGLKDRYRVCALACGQRWELMVEQAQAYQPERVAVAEPAAAREVERALAGTGTEVLSGPEAALELARMPADVTLAAIQGSAGVEPTLEAAGSTKVLALASKEALVEAGELVRERTSTSGARLVPVDSEHSSVFQALLSGRREEVRRVILTASGGPFASLSREELERVTPE